jgi:hypothetical protein
MNQPAAVTKFADLYGYPLLDAIKKIVSEHVSRPLPKTECKNTVYERYMTVMRKAFGIEGDRLNHSSMRSCENRSGAVWQDILASGPGWVNLGQGHDTHMDAHSPSTNTYCEIKHKYNTTNNSSRNNIIDCLVERAKHGSNGFIAYVFPNEDSRCPVLKRKVPRNDDTVIYEYFGDCAIQQFYPEMSLKDMVDIIEYLVDK